MTNSTLNNRVAIVTSGGQGLVRAMAQGLARAGDDCRYRRTVRRSAAASLRIVILVAVTGFPLCVCHSL